MEQQQPRNFPRKIMYSLFKDIRGAFENVGEKHKELFFEEFQKVLREEGMDLTKNVKVLEVGSGNAAFLDFLRKKGVNVVGIDAEPRGTKDSPQIIGRIEQLPFREESFDVVLSTLVFDSGIYHQDQDFMIREIARVLKHGGVYLGQETSNIHASLEGFNKISYKSPMFLQGYKKS
jgi:ubiquinone/menaquinone biosynthesis C-methylase UbiE